MYREMDILYFPIIFYEALCTGVPNQIFGIVIGNLVLFVYLLINGIHFVKVRSFDTVDRCAINSVRITKNTIAVTISLIYRLHHSSRLDDCSNLRLHHSAWPTS